jgi:hypothetical protein
VWPNFKYIHVSVPAFWFQQDRTNGFLLQNCMFWLVVGTPCSAFDLSIEFFLVHKETNADTVLCKNGGVLW